MTRTAPRQDRSRRTEQVLLDAALTLFRARGADAVTVGDIAAAAGVAPATIYRRFTDKAGLEREAFARFVDQSLAMLEAAPPPRAQGRFINHTAEATVQVVAFIRANQRLLQSAYARALSDDFHADRLVALRTRTFASLKAHFLVQAGEIGHPDPALAIDFMLRQAVAMLSARLEAGRLEVGDGAMSDAVFLREMLRSILSYLQVPHTATDIDRALAARGL